MTRPAGLALLLALATGCRVERTWYGSIDMTPGTTRTDVWIATVADRIAADHHAENCGSPTVASVSEGLSVDIVDWDGWQGECWALTDVTLAADAPDTTEVTLDFSFDLCTGAIGRDAVCPAEGNDTTQERSLTVNAR